MTRTDAMAEGPSDLVRFLQITGQSFTFEGQWARVFKVLQVLRTTFMMICCFLTLWALFIGGLRSSLGIEVCYAGMGLMTVIQHLYLCVRRKETEEIIRTIQEIRNTFQKGTEEEFKEDMRVVWTTIKMYTVVVISVIIAMSFPFFGDLLAWAVWRTPKAFRIPMAMDSFLDKQPTRDATYFAVVLTSSAWMVFGCGAQVGIDTLLFISCSSYSSMVMTFCKGLRVHQLTPVETTVYLQRLAAHQEALYKLSIKIKRLLGFPFFAQNLLGAFGMCPLLYGISSDGKSINPLLLIAYVINFVVVFMILGSTAYVGQQVKNKSSKVFEALYEMDWYNLRPSDRMYLVTMLGAAREPLTIHFCGLLPLDMDNFMNILYTSYSYFMFLKSMV